MRRDSTAYVFLTVPTVGISPSQNFRPASERISDAIDAVRKSIPGEMRIVMAQMYGSDDLYLAPNMARMIATTLNTYSTPELRAINAKRFSPNLAWVVEPSVTAASDFVASLMPTHVRPPADFGFILGVRKPGRYTNSYDRDRGDDNDSMTNIVAVTAYTEFLGPWKDPRSNDWRFQPVIHGAITASTVMLPVIENLALAQLIQQGVIEEDWKTRFRHFGAEGSQNIGTLTRAEGDRSQLFRVSDMDQFDDFMRFNMFDPIVVIDVMDGYYRIPSRLCYTNRNAEDADVLIDDTARFFDVPRPQLVNQPSSVIGKDYVGTYGEGDRKVDSRCFTYLEMTRRGAPAEAHREIMLEYQRDERTRAELISNLNPGFQSLYLNRSPLISPEYMICM